MVSAIPAAERGMVSHPMGMHDAMKSPTLFDPDHPSLRPPLPLSRSTSHERAQLRIRELNDERRARQGDDLRLRRRRAAVARLHRRRFHADEVEAAYWERRRATLHPVS